MPDIETLRLLWWFIIGFLFIGFAISDGYDFGTAILYPLISKNEIERRIILNTIRPFWEGNQVWIILAAGSLFAAWPFVYAVAFSGAYFAVLLLLLTMGILRPVSFKYRSKLANPSWQRTWDVLIFIGGFFPALIFGILIGNTYQGLPFSFDATLRIQYTGTFLALFNPFALFCGLTSVAMLCMHGGLWVALKTESPIHERVINWAKVSIFITILLFIFAGVWAALWLPGYQVVSAVDPYGPSNPLNKQVVMRIGAWMLNFVVYPYAALVPFFAILSALFAYFAAAFKKIILAFIFSSITVAGMISTVGITMFPFILPSSSNYAASLLIWDSSSTRLTLLVMLFAVLFFMPIILIYTAWVYRVLRGKVRKEFIEQEAEHTIY